MIEKIKDAVAILILIACGLIIIMTFYIFIMAFVENIGNWHFSEVMKSIGVAAGIFLFGIGFFFILAWSSSRIKKKLRK